MITQDNVSASFGLSADEVIGERVGTGASVPTLRLYTYKSHCGLVGRFQNIQNELRLDFCKENHITVNRRPTGGGAIIMGDGQLGLALMLPGQAEDTYSRARDLMLTLSEGIIKGLNELGVNAQVTRMIFWSTAERLSARAFIARTRNKSAFPRQRAC